MMQIKNTVKYSLISIRIAIIKKMDSNQCLIKNVEKSQPSYTAGETVK